MANQSLANPKNKLPYLALNEEHMFFFGWHAFLFTCVYNIRTRSDFEKHLTIKNCDKTFLKIILRLKNC